jgi:hypothetical protein
MVEDAHIDALIDIARQYARENSGLEGCQLRWRGRQAALGCCAVQGDDYTSTGRMLLAENARSTAFRYGDTEAALVSAYTYRPTNRSYTPGQALVTIAGYEYQACEAPDWQLSHAHSFCRKLFWRVISIAIPQTDDETAFWAITEHVLGRHWR